jgi:hypothetical protein
VRRSLASALLSSLLAASGARAQTANWDGRYVYEHTGGATTGGSVITLDYTVLIASPPTPHCSISINGFQTSDELLCTVRADSKGVTLLFKEYATGKVTNQYDVAVYPVGAPLLSFSRDSAGRLITTWRKLLSSEAQPRPSGRYFVRKAVR